MLKIEVFIREESSSTSLPVTLAVVGDWDRKERGNLLGDPGIHAEECQSSQEGLGASVES